MITKNDNKKITIKIKIIKAITTIKIIVTHQWYDFDDMEAVLGLLKLKQRTKTETSIVRTEVMHASLGCSRLRRCSNGDGLSNSERNSGRAY